MDLFNNLAIGFGTALKLTNLAYAFIGCLLGTLIGVLPGLGPLTTIAMLLPITYALSPDAALIMLAGIYYGAQYGGSTTAIVVNLPGESSSVVTTIDGYQMARQGRAGVALSTAAIGSFFAGCVATLAIAALAQPLASVALQFGPKEYFSLMILGLLLATVLSNGPFIEGVGMILFGTLLSLTGTDVNTGTQRFAFDIPQLFDGLDFVPLAMGIFGFAEIVKNLEPHEERTVLTQKITNMFPTREDYRRMIPAILRGTTLGTLLGVLPGGGAVLSSFAAYTLEKKLSKTPEQFGKGAIEGVAGPGSRQQRRRADLVHSAADAGPAVQRRDGADGRRDDHPQHPARSAGDDQEPGTVLGSDRIDVGRQPDAGGAQPAAGRTVGEAPDHSLPLPLSRDHRVLLHRHATR